MNRKNDLHIKSNFPEVKIVITTKQERNMNTKVLSSLLIPLALLAACSKPLPPEEQVKKRVEARYAALLAGDSKKAYEFLTPAKREALSYENYIRTHPQRLNLKSAKVLKVTCQTPDACQAEVEIEYSYQPGFKGHVPGQMQMVKPEKWVRVDGQWWFFIKK